MNMTRSVMDQIEGEQNFLLDRIAQRDKRIAELEDRCERLLAFIKEVVSKLDEETINPLAIPILVDRIEAFLDEIVPKYGPKSDQGKLLDRIFEREKTVLDGLKRSE